MPLPFLFLPNGITIFCSWTNETDNQLQTNMIYQYLDYTFQEVISRFLIYRPFQFCRVIIHLVITNFIFGSINHYIEP